MPALTWLGYHLFLAPAAGEEPVADSAFAANFSLALLVILPLALAWFIRSTPTPPWWAVAGWLGLFAISATATLALFWFAPAPALGASNLWRFAWWWACWGGFWAGVLGALQRLGSPPAATQIVVAVGALALATSIFWLNPSLERLESSAVPAAIDRTVRFSPMYGVLAGALDQNVFRLGRLYNNPDGPQLSVIGDHILLADTWPSVWELGAQWALLGAVLYGLALAVGAAGRTWRHRVRRPTNSDGLGTARIKN